MKYNKWKYDISDLVSEKDKSKDEYLIANIDYNISTLVYEKEDLKKAYNYYNCKRDSRQFAALEENYGIGNPTCVEFIPLIRKHIDALVGEHLRNRIEPRITFKDRKTIDFVEREKNNKLIQKLLQRIYSQVENTKKAIKESRLDIKDLLSEEEIERLVSDFNTDFISNFEIAASHILSHLIKSKEVDLRNKLKIMFTDLLVTGSCYYRVRVENKGEDPILDIINPLDIFYRKNTNYTYINQCTRIVHRMYMTRQEALNRFGHQLTEDDKKILFGHSVVSQSGVAKFIHTRGSDQGNELISNTGSTIENSNYRGFYFSDDDIIIVYHCEWLANNVVEVDGKKKYRLDRYEGYRIGDSIYVGMGKSKNVIRSMDRPYDCSLSYNGLSYSDRNNTPYSLVLQTATLQDKYDLIHFHRDTLIANSGVKGSIVDVAAIPTFLDPDITKRIIKWKAYKKGGDYLINSAQEGQSGINTIYQGFDDTVNGQAIQSLNFVIQSIEETASSITGVYKPVLGNIEQRDAVTNVQTGINQSAIITKQFHFLMDEITKSALTDLLNISRVTYSKGLKGTYLLSGGEQRFFDARPEYYTMTDYDVHVSDSGQELRDAELIKQLTLEMIKGGMGDADTIVTMITSKSLTEMASKFKATMKDNTQQTIQQLQQQLDQVNKEYQKLSNQVSEKDQAEVSLKMKEFELKQKEILGKLENEREKIKVSKEANKDKLEEIKKRTDLEKAQLYTSNTAKEVKNLD